MKLTYSTEEKISFSFKLEEGFILSFLHFKIKKVTQILHLYIRNTYPFEFSTNKNSEPPPVHTPQHFQTTPWSQKFDSNFSRVYTIQNDRIYIFVAMI